MSGLFLIADIVIAYLAAKLKEVAWLSKSVPMMGIDGLGYIAYLNAVSGVLYGLLSPTTANIVIGLSSAFVESGTVMFAVLPMHPDIPPRVMVAAYSHVGSRGYLR